ncbi:MAG: DUF1800 domain-containing protein [Sandaracinaceae bacterium]
MRVRSLVSAGLLLALIACGSPTPRPAPDPAPVTPTTPTSEPSEPDAREHARRLVRRLTWGARPGELDRVAADPEAFLRVQLTPAPLPDDIRTRFDVFGTPVGLATRYPRTPPRQAAMMEAASDTVGDDRDLARRLQEFAIVRAIEGEGRLHDLLVDLYFNHLNVFVGKRGIPYFLPDYERSVIAANLDGTYDRMVLGSARHPAMLLYLDNANSVAPRPDARGARANRGLNENYARELLELHTLGVDAGYTQDDVEATARLLTGWNLSAAPREGEGREGDRRFLFRERQHDDAPRVILGERYTGGEAEGTRLLTRLATDPRTRQRLASRIALRFLGEDEDAAARDRLAESLGTRADLAAMHRALLTEVRADRTPGFKTPFDFVVSAARAVGGHVTNPRPLRQALTRLRMLPYQQPLPTGYAFEGAVWRSSGAMVERMQVAWSLTHGTLGVSFDLDLAAPPVADQATLVAWAEALLGPLSHTTRATLMELDANDEATRRDRLAIALASPEFMER